MTTERHKGREARTGRNGSAPRLEAGPLPGNRHGKTPCPRLVGRHGRAGQAGGWFPGFGLGHAVAFPCTAQWHMIGATPFTVASQRRFYELPNYFPSIRAGTPHARLHDAMSYSVYFCRRSSPGSRPGRRGRASPGRTEAIAAGAPPSGSPWTCSGPQADRWRRALPHCSSGCARLCVRDGLRP